MDIKRRSKRAIGKSLELPSLELTDLLDSAIVLINTNLEGAEYSEIFRHIFKTDTGATFLTLAIETVLKELVKEGYVYIHRISVTEEMPGYLVEFYCITPKGERFCKRPILWLKNKPFKYQLFTEKLNVIWKITKIVAAALVAIATFFMSLISFLEKI